MQVHIIVILIPCIFATLSTLGVLRRPCSFFMGVSSAFWGCMVGVGYAMTAMLCFPINFLPGRPCLDDDHPSIKIGKIPAQFLLAFAYSAIIVAALFLLFGISRGMRLGRKNPEYYVHDDGAMVGNCCGDDNEEKGYHVADEKRCLMNEEK
jgi:hypothetical protein